VEAFHSSILGHPLDDLMGNAQSNQPKSEKHWNWIFSWRYQAAIFVRTDAVRQPPTAESDAEIGLDVLPWDQVALLSRSGWMDEGVDLDPGDQISHIHDIRPSNARPVEALIKVQQPAFVRFPGGKQSRTLFRQLPVRTRSDQAGAKDAEIGSQTTAAGQAYATQGWPYRHIS